MPYVSRFWLCGAFTHHRQLFQESSIRLLASSASIDYNSTPEKTVLIFSLSLSLFTRRYSGNPSKFLFLRLLICLSLAGSLVLDQVRRRCWLLLSFESLQVLLPEIYTLKTIKHLLPKHACKFRRIYGWIYSRNDKTLMKTCHQANLTAPFAFKNLVNHWILLVTLRIAVGCVLHRCGAQDIHRWK